MSVALHPEATTDPLTLRWVTDATLPALGLQALIDDGTLAAVEVGPGEIRTRLAADRSWAGDGARVRSALFVALSEAPAAGLRAQVAEVLRREVEPYVDSHGGRIEIVELTDDALTVSLGGTCGHCTLRNSTLRTLVAGAVQKRFPQIHSVRSQ